MTLAANMLWTPPRRALMEPEVPITAALFHDGAFRRLEQLEHALCTAPEQLARHLVQHPSATLRRPSTLGSQPKEALQQKLRSIPWPEVGSWIDDLVVDEGSASAAGELALRTRAGWCVCLPHVPTHCDQLLSWDQVTGLPERLMQKLCKSLGKGRSVSVSGLGLFSAMHQDDQIRIHLTAADTLTRALNGETSNDPIGAMLRPGHSLLLPELGFLHTRPSASTQTTHRGRWELYFQPLPAFVARVRECAEAPTSDSAPPREHRPWWRRLLP